MTGYSGRPLWKKVGIKENQRLTLVDAPEDWTVPDLPSGVEVAAGLQEGADVVIAFHREAAELESRVEVLGQAIYPDGMVWIAWPRRAGGHDSDITENAIRDLVLPHGLVDVKVAALDDDWSGLKIVWRLERRG
jgi:hypothetical protein